MADHNDLLAAALNAVNAVEAKSAAEAAKSKLNPLPPPSEDLNAEGIDEADDLDFHLSVSAFNRLLDEPIDVEDDEDLICTDDVDTALPEPKPVQKSEPKPEPKTTKPALQTTARPTIPYLQTIQKFAPIPSQNTNNAELESLRQQLKKANEENESLRATQAQLNEKILRLTADFDNYRKRIARDQEQMHNQDEERIVVSFLGVMDNFERAIAHAKQTRDYDQLLQGVELTSKQYLSTLAKHGCVPYDSMGKEFDPNFHDVLQRTVDSDVPHNTVTQEHLKGYMMHDHVIRPALVVVAQHDGNEPKSEAEPAETKNEAESAEAPNEAESANMPEPADIHTNEEL